MREAWGLLFISIYLISLLSMVLCLYIATVAYTAEDSTDALKNMWRSPGGGRMDC